MSGLGPSFMKIWTCGSSPRSGSLNARTRMKNFVWATSGIFSAMRDPNDFPSQLLTMDETRLYHYDPETKQQSMEWRHSGSPRPIPKKSAGKVLACLDFLWSRRHPPHWLSSKGPNYCRVLLISAGVIEGHFEGKVLCLGKVTMGVLFLHNNALARRALATQKKPSYLGFQCLHHAHYSLDLAPSDYHLFPGQKKQLKGCHFSSDMDVIASAETWLDGQPSEFFLSGLQKLEQQAKKCIELHGEYVE